MSNLWAPKVSWKKAKLYNPDNDRKADITQKLRGAVLNADIAGLRRIAQNHNLNDAKFWFGVPLLHDAIRQGNDELICALVDIGADINAANNDGRTALHMVTRSGNLKLVKKFLTANANINKQTKDGKTALHIAIWQRHSDIIDLLIQHHVDVNLQDKDGWSPLFFACHQLDVQLTQKLILCGVELNGEDKVGKSALLVTIDAVTMENRHAAVQIISLLVQHGTDLKYVSKKGSLLCHLIQSPLWNIEFAWWFHMAGYDLTQEEWLRNKDLTLFFRMNPDDKERLWAQIRPLREQSDIVPSLKFLARNQVRWQISSLNDSSIMARCGRLPFPRPLLLYTQLQYEIDYLVTLNDELFGPS